MAKRALGMIAAARLSEKMGYLEGNETRRIERLSAVRACLGKYQSLLPTIALSPVADG